MRKLPPVRSHPAVLTSEAGHSFVELLVTLLLLALMVGGILPLLTSGGLAYDEAERRQLMIQNARTALDRLLREMRAAESFRAIGPGLIRFTMSWGDGSGGSPTVEYSLNAGTNALEYRWSAAWDYRMPLVITAVNAVPTGYAIPVTFNHAGLVAAGKSLANGDDVRVRFESGGVAVELDRVLDPTSAWNQVTTKVWFRLQAAIAAAGIENRYALYYGNPSASSPPANGDHVFLDYENGTTLDGWTRRDARSGNYAWSANNGFVFTAAATNGFRELSKNVPNGNVEIFWGFRAEAAGNNRRQMGVGARLSNTGRGYRLTPSDTNGNNQLRVRFWNSWAAGGGNLGTAVAPVAAFNDYFARFYLVGTSIQAKQWLAILPEPLVWQVILVNANAASGNHFSLTNGNNVAMDHRHRTVIVRPRVAVEPAVVVGLESAGGLGNPLATLAGPFRSMTVTCFDAAGAPVACVPAMSVREVEVSLVAMDPDGHVADIAVTGRAYRQRP